jgi:hypothetical protein
VARQKPATWGSLTSHYIGLVKYSVNLAPNIKRSTLLLIFFDLVRHLLLHHSCYLPFSISDIPHFPESSAVLSYRSYLSHSFFHLYLIILSHHLSLFDSRNFFHLRWLNLGLKAPPATSSGWCDILTTGPYGWRYAWRSNPLSSCWMHLLLVVWYMASWCSMTIVLAAFHHVGM